MSAKQEIRQKAAEKLIKMIEESAEKENKTKLVVDISADGVYIDQEDGTEVVCWTEDEWMEDPSVTICIASAVHMAHTEPDELIRINQKHIDSQKSILREEG